MTSPQDSPTRYFDDLFERARRALAERAASDRDALHAEPNGAAAGDGRGAAQLRLDEATRDVLVRFYDTQTGHTIVEVPPQLVAAAAARLRKPTV